MVLIFLKWVLVLQIIGIIGFPISYFLFKNVKGIGIGFSKPLGILFLCSTYWIISHIPYVSHGNSSLFIWFFFLLSSSLIYLILKRNEIILAIQEYKVLLLTIELMFFLVLLLWLFVRFIDPNIYGTEKPMDFMMMNSVVNSSNFPPHDLWFSGEVISYYYFGYWIFGIISILSNVSLNFSYNLSVATVAALVSSSVFGLVSMLIKENNGSQRESIIVSVATIFFILFSSNLHIIWETLTFFGILSKSFLTWLSIDGLSKDIFGDWYLSGGWWRSTRIINFFENGQGIDYTISEFPLFSFILGDLHPHLMSIPFLILSLSSLYIFQFIKIKNKKKYDIGNIIRFILITMIIGAVGFINGWDFPVLILIFIIFYIFFPLIRSFFDRFQFSRKYIFILPIMVVLPTLIFFSQYYIHLGNQIQFPPILPVKVSSRLIHFITIWGFFLIIISPVFIRNSLLIKKDILQKNRSNNSFFFIIFTILFTIIFIFWSIGNAWIYDQYDFSRVIHNLLIIFPLFILLLLSSRSIFNKSENVIPNPGYFFHGLLFVSLLILLGVEMFRLNDFFGNRMNTIFKTYYQVWTFLSLVSGYVIWDIFFNDDNDYVRSRFMKILISFSLISLFIFSSYYFISSINDRSNGFKNETTLDGLKFLQTSHSSEYKIIEWIKKNTEKGDVILESVGQDYSDSSLISTFSGRPTVLGWMGHEHQWRGDFSLINSRNLDVTKIYTSNDLELKLRLIKKYNVKYVIFGEKEKNVFGISNYQFLQQLGDLVFNENGNIIIKIYE